MKSKFALSFGISLILVGILNIFFNTSNIILLGLSISSILFSMISINFSLKYIVDDTENSDTYEFDWIYVIPFAILISFCCYGNTLIKFDFIDKILKSNITSILTFVSFGLLFISEFINHIKETYQERNRILSIIEESLEYTSEILKISTKFHKLLKRGNDIDDEILNLLLKLDDMCRKKTEKNAIEIKVLKIQKESYSLGDIDKVLSTSLENKKR